MGMVSIELDPEPFNVFEDLIKQNIYLTWPNTNNTSSLLSLPEFTVLHVCNESDPFLPSFLPGKPSL